jgi:hypothetical protein
MASKESDGPPQSTASSLYSTAAGRLVPSLAGRLPPPGLHTAPYARPHDFYRSLYGPAGQHLDHQLLAAVAVVYVVAVVGLRDPSQAGGAEQGLTYDGRGGPLALIYLGNVHDQGQ